MSKKLSKAKRLAGHAAIASKRVATAAARAASAGARKAASATGHAARVGGELISAAVFGNEAERMLAISAHDTIRDVALARDEAQVQPREAAGGERGSIPDAEVIRLLRTVGTSVWKLDRRMIDEGAKEPKDEFRKVWRHVEAIRDALADIGVEVIDMTGRRYDEGMPIKVVSEEERSGLKEAEITETLLPMIRFRKQILLQQAEVIVGRPGALSTNDEAGIAVKSE